MVQAQDGGWSDDPWANTNGQCEIDRLIRVIAWETILKLGNRLTTRDHRHITITIQQNVR